MGIPALLSYECRGCQGSRDEVVLQIGTEVGAEQAGGEIHSEERESRSLRLSNMKEGE